MCPVGGCRVPVVAGEGVSLAKWNVKMGLKRNVKWHETSAVLGEMSM
jgi:hypothetical protein